MPQGAVDLGAVLGHQPVDGLWRLSFLCGGGNETIRR